MAGEPILGRAVRSVLPAGLQHHTIVDQKALPSADTENAARVTHGLVLRTAIAPPVWRGGSRYFTGPQVAVNGSWERFRHRQARRDLRQWLSSEWPQVF